jgi:DNA (cytosine-5)-methyltransferase 1
MTRAYYNEFDPYAAQWLRNLIDAGLIAPGDVDTRSITDVRPADLAGYTQAHFFAGIGGWSLAARLAGWPDDRPLWTGSAPCQPFSVAGAQKGQSDERHLWPVFAELIRTVRPPVVMGEQVAAAVGKDWLDGVCADLEGIGYACGAAVVPACAVDAPHRRDRLWFVADAGEAGRERGAQHDRGSAEWQRPAPQRNDDAGRRDRDDGRHAGDGDLAFSLADPRGRRRGRPGQGQAELAGRAEAVGPGGGDVANADEPGLEGRRTAAERRDQRSAWSDGVAWVRGADGKARRVEPGIRLLAHGVQARVGRLRAYGNAIVPQVAAEVIGAYLDAEGARPVRLEPSLFD